LKMNSGMNRLGFTPAAFRSAWTRLNALPQVDEITLMTHFSDADGPRGVAHQVAAFEAATHDLPGERSLSNSAATLVGGDAPDPGRPAVKSDWVRAGILSYGSAPDHPARTIDDWGLRPAMTLRTRLIATQELAAGDTVGYGSTYTASGPMRIGIAACGYADGYPRHCGTGTPVLVEGVRCTTVGRVSMDMLAVDLTRVPGAGPGSEVTLWGEGPAGSRLPIDEVAQAAGTIGYELMCALAARVPVRVVA
ncbi:MAG: alanine racemase, partial [Rubrivivax sp.]